MELFEMQRGVPWWSRGQSLVWEMRFQIKPWGAVKKKKKKRERERCRNKKN